MAARKIAKVWKSQPTLEGAGVHLKRAFGNQEVPQLDPFLLLDDFRNTDPERYLPGFPWHPHRGIETITYVLDGEVDHGDSMGNSGTIGPGDIQWMTAGSGIIHQEMPRGNRAGVMGGFQLWANLPAVAQDDGAAIPRPYGGRDSRGEGRGRRGGQGRRGQGRAAPPGPCATS